VLIGVIVHDPARYDYGFRTGCLGCTVISAALMHRDRRGNCFAISHTITPVEKRVWPTRATDTNSLACNCNYAPKKKNNCARLKGVVLTVGRENNAMHGEARFNDMNDHTYKGYA